MAHASTAIEIDAIKEIVSEHLGATADVRNFEPERDLYAAGLTSLATVGLMLALEERFDIEFSEAMLSRGTFRSIASIAEAVSKLAR
ncbi:MAG: acyl carrier protein [Planctomycetia bacterium]|nr:acyl carrier protein [Planctomycetia bacterium]